MAAPTWQSTTVTDFGADATAHAANMPATVNSGDLLLAVAAFDSGSTTITTPSGWTKLLDGTSSDPVSGIYAKSADGTEDGTTVDFATSNAQRGSVHVLRITGWSGTLDDIKCMAGGPGASGGTGLNMAIGTSARDVLWVLAQVKSATTAFGTTPTGYSNESKTNVSEDTAASGAVATATKAATSVASELGPAIWNSSTATNLSPAYLLYIPSTAAP